MGTRCVFFWQCQIVGLIPCLPTGINSHNGPEDVFTSQKLQPKDLLNVLAYQTGRIVRKAQRKFTCEPRG